MKFPTLILSGLIAGFAPWVTAQNIDVEITNLTQGMYFTPLLIAAHGSDSHLFEVGTAASSELQAMAEGGDLSGLTANLDSIGAVSVTNPAEGLLPPATAVNAMNIDTGNNGLLSIVAMLLPTNDGFIGLDAWQIPATAGSSTIWLNAYDAGTEANDELVTGGGAPGIAGIPGNPGENGGTAGTGVTTEESNQTVHIHRGNVGDTNSEGGISDVDSRIHRWLNPVARIVVTVK